MIEKGRSRLLSHADMAVSQLLYDTGTQRRLPPFQLAPLAPDNRPQSVAWCWLLQQVPRNASDSERFVYCHLVIMAQSVYFFTKTAVIRNIYFRHARWQRYVFNRWV